MSERKVLNKYYPPDFDPSKIPRSKVGRNKSFTIRLMAPCNMRCTTCGEYIYKGRKFNSRKEDVDDMNHLGLRIYRFYIKCTACLSEISFRTDPANTDYILEAGATRNFEALSKAEKQAEMEEKAYKEELQSNPMKLLEERTEASKNEMERMEALEELQELNKRTVKVNYDTLLSKYDQMREKVGKDQEQEDENFVKATFGKQGSSKIKRLQEDNEDSSSSEDEDKPARKVTKTVLEKPTDLLAKKEDDTKTKAWQKSIGTLSATKGKGGLGLLVKPKSKEVKKKSEEEKPSVNPLSLIGQYSDSSEDST